MTEPLTVKVRATAGIKDARQALTDPAALKTWLAEYAEVELPGRFEFWGRFTPEGDKPHQTVLYADDDTIRFTWRLDGEDTTSEISLTEESAESTVITVTQTHFNYQEALAGTTIRGVLQVYWSLVLANLVDYLEGRELTPQTDFTSSDLRGSVVIDAPVDAVYTSLTDSDQASAWFGFPIGIEPWVGGRFAMGGFDNPDASLIVDLEPGRKMSTDWGPGFGSAPGSSRRPTARRD